MAERPDGVRRGDVAPIKELIDVLKAQASLMVSSREHFRRQLAAASLARCRSLMEAMLLLRDAERDDVSGVLRRCLVEHYFLGRYLLKMADTPASVIGLASEDFKTYEAILRESGVRLEGDNEATMLRERHAAIREEYDIPKKPSVEALARALNELPIYTGLYRRESLNGSHASPYGLHAYLHLDPDEQHDSVCETRDPFPWSLWECGLFTAKLGWEVAKAFDLPEDDCARILTCFDGIHSANPMRDEITTQNERLKERIRRSQGG